MRPVTCAQLVLGRDQEEAAKRQFVCAHCFKPTAEKYGKVYDFNALRSHVKAKSVILSCYWPPCLCTLRHRVATIRKEDYFFDPSVAEYKSKYQDKIFILNEEAYNAFQEEVRAGKIPSVGMDTPREPAWDVAIPVLDPMDSSDDE